MLDIVWVFILCFCCVSHGSNVHFLKIKNSDSVNSQLKSLQFNEYQKIALKLPRFYCFKVYTSICMCRFSSSTVRQCVWTWSVGACFAHDLYEVNLWAADHLPLFKKLHLTVGIYISIYCPVFTLILKTQPILHFIYMLIQDRISFFNETWFQSFTKTQTTI